MFRKIAFWFRRTRKSEVLPRWGSERFIPLHVLDLVRLLYPKVTARGQDPEEFRVFCRLMLSLIHQQYRRKHQKLTHLYNSLDPDVDAENPPGFTIDASLASSAPFLAQFVRPIDEATSLLFHDLGDVLERANYRRLSPRQIQLAVGSASYWGVKLRVRFSMFRRLEVYARGDVEVTRYRRRWYRFWKREQVRIPIYQRLVILFRSKEDQVFDEQVDPDRVQLRMFKNIPKYDIDMLLPGTGIRMSWFDHGKIGIPSLWGLAMLIWKIIRNSSLLALIGIAKFFASAVLTVAVVIALIFFLIKSFFSYTSTKRRYLLDVARNLYYQNLDNNMGALLRLLEEAEQQEACESILAYFVLASPEIVQPIPMAELDQKCESLLKELTGVQVDFDVDDALRDLAPLEIVSLDHHGWSALPMKESLVKLNEIWDNSFFPN